MILSAGEALFDMIQMPGMPVLEPVIGGSPLNVAVGLARLGQPTAFLTKLSDDYFGTRLRAFLTREGIDTSLVTTAPGTQTTLAFAFLQQGGHASYAFYAEGAADRSIMPDDLPAILAPDITTVHFGSISLALEPSATTLSRFLLDIAPTRVISLDPNIRAGLIPDRTVWITRFEVLLAAADVIKASTDDIRWIYGEETDAGTIARRWSMSGPKIAIITGGEVGATIAVGGHSGVIPAHKIKVVDTVGAGDTFQAACLARLAELGLLSKEGLVGINLAEAMAIGRFAAVAAAITCTRRGADMPSRANVDAVLSLDLSTSN